MRKKTFRILTLFLAAAFLLCFAVTAFGDFGDFAGDTDFGGGGDDFGGGDFGGYDGGYDGGDYDYDSGSGGGSGGPGVVVFVIIVILYLVIKYAPLGKTGRKGSRPSGASPTAASSLKSVESYRELDPGFEAFRMQEKLSNLYVQMQNAWQNKDISPIRPYMTDAYFAQMERQLDSLRKAGRTNYIDRIAVLDVSLQGWYQQGGQDCMVARLKTRIVDYTVEDASGRIVRGSNTKELFMDYEWTLTRPSGKTTAAQGAVRSVSCPHCGAPLSINQSAHCPYCGSVVTVDDYDWAIYSIKAISQRSGS